MLYGRLIGLQTPPDRKEKRKKIVAKDLCRDFFPDAMHGMSLEPAELFFS